MSGWRVIQAELLLIPPLARMTNQPPIRIETSLMTTLWQ